MFSTFGIGSPTTYPAQATPWSGSSFGIPGSGTYPSAQSTYGVQQPIQQLLQILPQQLQQLQQLAAIQQQQLQQVLQFVAQQQFGGGAQGLLGATGQLSQPQGFGAQLPTVSPFSPFAVSSGHVM